MAKVYCFGNTSNGELGLGGIEDEHILSPRKQKIPFDSNYELRQLCSGRNHTLILMENDMNLSIVLSCGSNERNQLGRSGSWKRLETIDALNQHKVIRLSTGANHSLVLTEAGQILSWGCNIFGQLGIGNKEDESVAKPSLVKRLAAEFVIQINCGANHNLALTKSGLIYSWGSNAFGQLGNGMKGNCENSPIEIVGLRCVPIHILSAGGSHSAVLSYTGTIYMWGKNEFGQLGLNDTINRVIPTVQTTLRSQKISFIDCGDEHTVALTSDGGLFSWGAGMYGQLGHNKNVNEILPRQVFELMGNTVTQVSCGRCHTLASVGSNGRVYTFGLNGSGQLGIGTQISKNVPTHVSGKWSELGIKDLSVRNIAGSLMRVPKETFPNSPKSPRKDRSPASEDDSDSEDDNSSVMSIDELSDDDIADEVIDDKQVIIEEPEDSRVETVEREPSFVCTQNTIMATNPNSIQIDEYISDFDSDSVLHVERQPLVLREIIASKGDQSFVLVVKFTDNSKLIDFRFLSSCEEICKLENAFELLKKSSEVKTIPNDDIDYIENVFSSISCWNASYINYNEKSETSLPAIHFNYANEGFRCLEQTQNNRIKELILQSILKIIPDLPNIYDQYSLDPEVLRIYLLLPLFHEFSTGFKSPEILKQLIGGYARAVIRLSDNAIDVFNDWLSKSDERYFQYLILNFKNYVEFLLGIQDKENQQKNTSFDPQLHENLGLCLTFLSLLNRVNQKSGKVSYKEFYIEGISDKFDLKRDYIHWLSSRVNQSLKNTKEKTLYLCDFAFIFDPPAKTQILATDSAIQQQNAAENSIYQSLVPLPFLTSGVIVANPYLVLSVSRNSILQESVNLLCSRNQNPSEFKKPLKVNFEGEEAIDAGQGMKKEFFLLLLKEMLDKKFGMFTEYEETNTIWFNPGEVTDKEDLVMYNLIGIVCGLAIYNQVIIYLPFPLTLYRKLLNETLNIEDLNSLDPLLVKNLKEIINTSYNEQEFDAIYGDLNFTISLSCFGSAVEYELEKDGKQKTLNWKNRHEYVRLYWDFILNKSVEKQFYCFKSGFNKVLDTRILQLFHAEELMQLVSGQEVYDWVLLENTSTQYKPPFNASHPTIIMFWKVFHSLTIEQKKKFLLFLTGSDRIPILGMKALKIIIQPMKVNEDHLPVAHTCFNVLDLPEEYSSEDKMRQKLLQSIEHTHGFSLA